MLAEALPCHRMKALQYWGPPGFKSKSGESWALASATTHMLRDTFPV